MVRDDEGYTCVLRGATWLLVDRYARDIGEPPYATYEPARKRADELNAAVHAARFKDRS